MMIQLKTDVETFNRFGKVYVAKAGRKVNYGSVRQGDQMVHTIYVQEPTEDMTCTNVQVTLANERPAYL